MRICIVTDAWLPQVNGVVTTLVELQHGLVARGHEVEVIEPSGFRRYACPGYREIELAWRPGRGVEQALALARPDAIHIATEGPLGSAARAHCRRHGLAFTTAFHTRFPDILAQALRIPERWGYAWFKRFHAPSGGVMVPTAGMLEILRRHGFERLRQWSHGVDLNLFQPVPGADLGLPRPVFLYVGRVSYEKNLEAFLGLDLPGSKVVYGVGPLLARLKREHPEVHWRGVVPRPALVAIYGAADVFVFPSRSETFGLVMLEAMACGTPVAAYPVAGPLDVVGGSMGGVLDLDLKRAALHALELPRERARDRALEFDWHQVCRQFIGHLVPVRSSVSPDVTELSQKIHKLVA
jgi:glycosyltransferase involved in cell wall biosynthesis